ncbi:GNAT family N-acetyltransferase [Flavobacterium lindanitolerans]|uniref:GNAT family N-acetyltransferase n=1 Tax=Flavobacterium lindanitolerans TaxID=428988 RepID=UPI0028084BBE|nr:GNAT family N-acetyltransferase [Flavobacterium lindanitolerans]MDQ7959547.1 GNAT family N-acetyltransferase [Flavobacterium lindanitolerans]
MSLIWKIKPFKALSLDELYDLLELRTEVFIVEQNCVYQDIDSKDRKAIHLIGEFDGETVAYCRLFNAGDYFDESSIGRVIVKEKYRDRKWGHDLIREAIKAIKENFDEEKITISAQLYLKKFYESHGFSQTSEEYFEDGIPHIEMKRS